MQVLISEISVRMAPPDFITLNYAAGASVHMVHVPITQK